MRFIRDDALAPHLEPGRHAYRVLDTAGRLRGFVARGTATDGMDWYGFRPMPSRSRPWVVACVAATRAAAADRLIGGRP